MKKNKSNINKRVLAIVLCMALMLSSGISTMADNDAGTPVPENGSGQGTVMDNTDGEAAGSEDLIDQLSEEKLSEPEKELSDDTQEAEPQVEETEPSNQEDNQNTSDNEPEGTEEIEKVEWSQQVGNSIIKVSANKGALPEDAELQVTEITNQNEVENIEKAVEDKAIEEQFAIENIIAYDIKFMVGGTEVQPSSPVQVTVNTSDIETSKNTAVLHVDQDNTVEDMNGSVDEEGNVIFDAPHFSTYVIVQQGGSAVDITVEHYNILNGQKIYSNDELTLPVGGKVNDYAKATNWEVQRVNINGKDFYDEADYSEIKVASDTVIKIYYTPEKTTVTGATTFYDYTVKAGTSGSGNKTKYYSINAPENYGEGVNSNKKLSAGTVGQNYSTYKYSWKPDGSNKEANVWTGNASVVKGLLRGLDENGNVVFNYADPGFFDNDDLSVTVGTGYKAEKRNLRKVYKNYTLEFNQTGDSYELSKVKNGTNVVASSGNNFFPLDSVKDANEEAENAHNYYFGMRYDVTFQIGDYVGPLNYSFTGDDDLWVVLDGNQVVIDLGGIHDAATGSVDLWNYIGNPENLTSEQKQQEHTLTILYMERGAAKSNCKMNFTLPSARISEVTEVPMTNLYLNKVNKAGEPLEGAKFKLVNDDTNETFTASSLENGAVQFTKLREGEYTLTETQAPTGYIPSVDTWKVKVTLDKDGRAVANLYLHDGETEAKIDPDEDGIYKILNVTEQELIDSSMNYDKTATVKDWDERTYDINITASSKLTSTTTEEKGGVADIMMVLDKSGSMNYVLNEKSTPSFVYAGTSQNASKFSSVKDKLDTTKIYYYGTSTGYASSSEHYYANRPMIYINSAWQYWDGSSWNKINATDNKVIYTYASRLTGLKEASNAFINSTSTSSPESRIGVTAFSTSNSSVNSLTEVGSNPEGLLKNVNKLFADGGTSPGEGLKYAYDKLKSSKREDVPQYVILFTDGEPTGNGGSWSNAAAGEAKTQAEKLKQEGVIIYTVGLGLTSTAKGWLDGSQPIWDGNKNISGIASKDCALTAESIDELKEIFKRIQETITNNLDIKSAQIKDVIDPRFEILDDEGQPITKDYPGIKDGIKLKNGGTVFYDSETGYQYIVWNEQTIPNAEKGKWNKTITVRAKDTYIGGNNVTTNISPDSKISTGYGDAVLPQPPVNVKAELQVGNNEVTVYKGDTIPTDDKLLNTLFDVNQMLEKYEGVIADDFILEWYTDAACTEESKITKESLTSTIAESGVSYYLKVTYDAGPANYRSTQNTKGHIAGGEDHIVEAVNTKDANKLYGIYKVNVVAGEIQITKKLESPINKEQTFNFKVTKKNDSTFVKDIKIVIPANSTDAAVYDGQDLKNLARGEYMVTESSADGFAVKDVSINEKTDCANSASEESATFILGSDKKNKNVISDKWEYTGGGVLGVVAYTNEKVITNWDILKVSSSNNNLQLPDAEFELKSTDKTYYGKTDNTGKLIWYETSDFSESSIVATIVAGSYTLSETKAPLGYAVSNEKWTLVINKKGELKSIVSNSGEVKKSEATEGNTTVHFYFENTAVYELPSAGGPVIFLYMVGGILLMMAAALLLYKNKSREVLER